jgi:hypothetical protein
MGVRNAGDEAGEAEDFVVELRGLAAQAARPGQELGQLVLEIF